MGKTYIIIKGYKCYEGRGKGKISAGVFILGSQELCSSWNGSNLKLIRSEGTTHWKLF